jgi:hypothetical protein
MGWNRIGIAVFAVTSCGRACVGPYVVRPSLPWRQQGHKLGGHARKAAAPSSGRATFAAAALHYEEPGGEGYGREQGQNPFGFHAIPPLPSIVESNDFTDLNLSD